MRFFGHTVSSVKSAFGAGILALLAVGALTGATAASAQSATPYVLPFTMSTFAGPHATYTVGAPCGNFIALDTVGDGCLASQVSVGVEPHDIRVDPQGNVYWIDNGSTAVIHRINGQTTRETVYVGSFVNTSAACPLQTSPDTQGDNCPANDGGANVQKSMFTAKTPKSRGLAIGNNGDLFYADFGGNFDHKVSAATGILTRIAGTGTAGYVDGTVGTSQVSGTRGIGVDPSGNVYIADTGNNAIRLVPAPTAANPNPSTGSLTALNTTTPFSTAVASGVPALQATVDAPEDVQIDSNYNIYIADFGTKTVRAIYSGRGTLPGIVNPVAGYIYTIAGTPNGSSGATYTTSGAAVAPAVLATTIAFGGPRKISIDSRNNIYINDGNNVWFLDATTGYMRILAGNYGGTAGGGGIGCAASAAGTIGDGCPGAQASLYSASDLASAPDNQGNLYITDAEGGNAAASRLRKLLSGLNFPSVNAGSTLVQNLLIHYAAGDTAGTYTISGSIAGTEDFTVGTQTCTPQADTTNDCVVPITFKPARPGYDTATLVIRSTLGATNNYLLTGTGVANAIAIDPGSVTVQNGNVKAAQGVALDGAGNIYTADTGNNRVLITSADTGATTTFAGTGTAGNTGNGGAAAAATLNAPRAVTVDTAGNVFIADTGNNVVRRVAAGTGIITAYAGGGSGTCATASNSLGDGCAGTSATLNAPAGIVADSLGQIYVSDTGNNLIRVIGTNGYITTLAGGATAVCTSANNGGITIDVYGDNCSALQAILKAPAALAYDSPGRNILVADTGNNIVRKIYLGTIFEGTGAGTGGAVTPPTATAYSAIINPITVVAGTGAGGSVIDTNSTALGSQLNAPTGVAIGAAGSIYIADTGNNAVRLVSATTGSISTIVGILGSSGTGTVPGTASNVQLTAPAAVAVTPLGTLQIADSGNNRILTDVRSQVTFQFGRTNVTFQSPVQNFIETNIGTASATLPSPLLTQTPTPQTQFTLVPAAGSAGCVPGTLASGASCILQGQFTPATTGTFSTTFTEVGTLTTTGDPAITLTGTGAVLTRTTSTVTQTTPATGNPQFGGTLMVSAVIAPASCNAAAPTCAPTGTVRFIVDGGNPGSPVTVTPNATVTAGMASQNLPGLAVGPHTVSCNYSGDSFYAASTCGTQTITVTTASTTSLLSATNSNQVQFPTTTCTVPTTGVYSGDTICTANVLTATVMSNTVGTPTGTVTFYANGTAIGTSSLDPNSGVATLPLTFIRDANYNILYNNTLIPGNYTLTCTYNGAANYSVSNCASVPFVVLAQTNTFTLVTRGCALTALIPDGALSPTTGSSCPATNLSQVPVVSVGTAQGSTTDATIFVLANNTVSGTLKFSCSGLPHASTCTFSPQTLKATASTGFTAPQAVDMTLWTDLQPGPGVAANRVAAGSTSMAALLGWPITLIGLAGFLRFRRKLGVSKALTLLALTLMVAGSSLAVSGCGLGGPGAYKPDLTPAGTYPITVTVTNGTATQSTIVNFVVTAPGIPGQE